jgi:hypothetical protein
MLTVTCCPAVQHAQLSLCWRAGFATQHCCRVLDGRGALCALFVCGEGTLALQDLCAFVLPVPAVWGSLLAVQACSAVELQQLPLRAALCMRMEGLGLGYTQSSL